MEMTHFVIPDIVLPVGHGSIPWRAVSDKVPVTVKFSPMVCHEDYLGFQIWFEYAANEAQLEQLNRVAVVKYINFDTFIREDTGLPWTPNNCSYCRTDGRCELRYWEGTLANKDTRFEADTPEMFIKQVTNIITRGRKVYPKKKKEVDYSI